MRLRIVSWNLWGHGAPGTYLRDRREFRGAVPDSKATQAFDGAQVWSRRLPLLARAIRSTEPHLVCLQECLGSGTVPLASDLAAALDLPLYADPEAPYLAILSRLPAKTVETLSHLRARPLHVIVTAGSTDVSILCVHLPLARAGPRDELVRELGAWQSHAKHTILAGDLNASPSDELVRTLLASGYVDVSAACGPTMPNPQPVVRLDYVLARSEPPGEMSAVSAGVLGLEGDAEGFLPSDHAGVLVELEADQTGVPSPVWSWRHMNTDTIQRIADYVRRTMASVSDSDLAIGHDLKHVDRVRRWALFIARGEGFPDQELLASAALLHDIGLAHVEDRSRHAAVGAKVAAQFLQEEGLFSKPERAAIVDAVRHHNALGDLRPLATLVRDADMLDMLGAVGVMRAFTTKYALPEYDPRDIKGETWQMTARDVDRRFAKGRGVGAYIVDQINFQASCYESLRTATARRAAAPLVVYMRKFLVQLESEIDASTSEER